MLALSWKKLCVAPLAIAMGCAAEAADDPTLDPTDSLVGEVKSFDEKEGELGSVVQPLIYEDRCLDTITDQGAKLPYCTLSSIYTPNANVTRAIVFVHGSDRKAFDVFRTVKDRASTLGVDMTTLDIIAPQFLAEADVAAMRLGADWARWKDDSNSTNSWYYGGPSLSHGVWSAIALDHILAQLTLNRPNLKHVLVAGFSAGARLVSRYATATPHFLPTGATVSYWSAAAGNYMFTGNTRPFESPECTGSAPFQYPWGVLNRNQYMNNVSTATLRQNESNRLIYWTVGEFDTDLDKFGCFATQGQHRKERWERHALATFFECMTFATQDHCLNNAQVLNRSILHPGIGHSLIGAVKSVAGSNILFAKLRFSSNGKIPGMFCEQLLEPNDTQGTWHDNWLCSNIDMGLRWSSTGVISGMQCIQIHEAAEPASTTWTDNFICLPMPSGTQANIPLRWSSAGKIPGRQCEQFKETADPHTWSDNYLCW